MLQLRASKLQLGLVHGLAVTLACGPRAASDGTQTSPGPTSDGGDATDGEAGTGVEPGEVRCSTVHVGGAEPWCFELVPMRWTTPLGDFDADGRTDGAQHDRFDPVEGVRSNGTSFEPAWLVDVPEPENGAFVDPITLDGQPYMLATTPRTLHLYADLGSAQPPLVQTIQAFGEALHGFSYHRQLDTDLDGDDDLVVTTPTFGNEPPKIHILENRGVDLFGDPESVTLPELQSVRGSLTLADLDGDGMLDLFVDRLGDEWGLYFADPGGWSDPVIVSTPASTYDAREHGVVDLDLDGRSDLVAGGLGHALLALSEGRAQPTQISFDYSALASPDKDWNSDVRAANLDGDAEPELLVLLYPSDNEYATLEHVTLFILDGITADGPATVHEVELPVCPGQASHRMAPLEFDGDGRTDLIIDARGDCRDDGATLLLRRD